MERRKAESAVAESEKLKIELLNASTEARRFKDQVEEEWLQLK
jgi:hypothetical protein